MHTLLFNLVQFVETESFKFAITYNVRKVAWFFFRDVLKTKIQNISRPIFKLDLSLQKLTVWDRVRHLVSPEPRAVTCMCSNVFLCPLHAFISHWDCFRRGALRLSDTVDFSDYVISLFFLDVCASWLKLLLLGWLIFALHSQVVQC